MENKLIFDLEQQLDDIDIDSMKLDAVIRLKTWQKKMFLLVEKIYSIRLNEIDEIAFNLINEIKEKQNQLEQTNDKITLLKLQHEIEQLKSEIIVDQRIPENFHHLIERTIRVQRDEDQDDDDLVIIDIEDKIGEQVLVILPPTNSESRVSKILHSEPVQQALAVTLTNTLTHMGTLAATSTATIAATTLAKTALITTASGLGTMAFGMGKIALSTTQKVWSLMTSSHHL
jgi:hypothetical protein